MEPSDIFDELGDGLKLWDATGQHSDAVRRAIETGDWREVNEISWREELRLDKAA